MKLIDDFLEVPGTVQKNLVSNTQKDLLAIRESDEVGRGPVTPDEKKHILDQVLSDVHGEAWWPEIENKNHIIRAAYVKAIALATKGAGAPRPIKSIWIRGLHHFDMIVCNDKTQVTVIWLTPETKPDTPLLPGAVPSETYIVSAMDRVTGINRRYATRYTPPNVETTHSPDVGIQQLMDY